MAPVDALDVFGTGRTSALPEERLRPGRYPFEFWKESCWNARNCRMLDFLMFMYVEGPVRGRVT